MFPLNHQQIARARDVFAARPNLYWIIGPAAAGKSTVTRALAARTGFERYDMDEHSFGLYSYDEVRHPATWAWVRNESPLDFMLSLSPADFDALYRAANGEMLDLLADDVARLPVDAPLLIDGGVTHPAVIVQVFPPARMVCIDVDEATRTAAWNHDPARQEMRQWIGGLANPEAKWARFLQADSDIAATLRRECADAGITVIRRRDESTVDELVAAVATEWGMV